jgi:cytochrome c-type biogenesis protein
VFGLYLAGLLPIPALAREIRVQLSSRPTGPFGSLLVGVAFGAGWTPCIGPILASILLYVGLGTTALRGTLLLATYAVGLGLPFILASLAFNWFLASTQVVRRWIGPLERVAGILLALVGVAMLTGSFAALGRTLAGLGQLFTLKTP